MKTLNTILAVIVWIGGFILGCVYVQASFLMMLVCWISAFVTGCFPYTFARILANQEEIMGSLNVIRSNSAYNRPGGSPAASAVPAAAPAGSIVRRTDGPQSGAAAKPWINTASNTHGGGNWKCACGRENASYVYTCPCGRDKPAS